MAEERGDLFSPIADAKKTDEYYRKNVFEKHENGRAIVHFVTRDPGKDDVACLSVSLNNSKEKWSYWISSYRVSGKGEITDSKKVQTDDDLPYALRSLWSKALWLSSEEPHSESLLNGPTHLFFGGNIGGAIGEIQDPVPETMAANMVDFALGLQRAVQKGEFTTAAWKEKCTQLDATIPKLTTPRYSESPEDNELKPALDKMKALDVLHRVRYIILEGFGTRGCPKFKKELIAELEKMAPKEWAALMDSSGNKDNPKVTPIHPYLTPATVNTPTVEELNKFLLKYGLEIIGLDTEKLSFATQTENGMPSGMFNFVVKSVPIPFGL